MVTKLSSLSLDYTCKCDNTYVYNNYINPNQNIFQPKKTSKSTESTQKRINLTGNTTKLTNDEISKKTAVLYMTLNLKNKGISPDVFQNAIKGYCKLSDKGNGLLAIVDTNTKKYHLIDLEEEKYISQMDIVVGKGANGKMDNCIRANKNGSNETLSGFHKVGNEYYSYNMKKNAMRLIGLEQNINHRSLEKGTVIHYATGKYTHGCIGFRPVRKQNGQIDVKATNKKMELNCPKDTIMFTVPQDPQYYKFSKLYNK